MVLILRTPITLRNRRRFTITRLRHTINTLNISTFTISPGLFLNVSTGHHSNFTHLAFNRPLPNMEHEHNYNIYNEVNNKFRNKVNRANLNIFHFTFISVTTLNFTSLHTTKLLRLLTMFIISNMNQNLHNGRSSRHQRSNFIRINSSTVSSNYVMH